MVNLIQAAAKVSAATAASQEYHIEGWVKTA